MSRLKVHLRLLKLAGRTYRIVTLRPSTRVAFSTNFFHHTWHIVSGQQGAQLLARLLWGLSYQRQPGTLFLVHGPHIKPTPFEGERSDPFVLIPGGLTPVDPDALRTLKQLLPRLGPPTQTIRWQTFGLDFALQERREVETVAWQGEDDRSLVRQERMARIGGFICYTAPPEILRQQAMTVHRMRVRPGGGYGGMDYHFLGRMDRGWVDGEVQIFFDYADRVSAAHEARRQLVANPVQPVLSEEMQEVISRRRDRIMIQKQKARTEARRVLGLSGSPKRELPSFSST